MGALTLKPLAFKARAWEFTNIELINFLDSYCGLIAIQKRGGEIMRILPSRKDSYYWINDKVRFFFESLKKQRINYPFIIIDNAYIKLNWQNIILFIKYIKFISSYLNIIEAVFKNMNSKVIKIFKDLFFDKLSNGSDIISNLLIKDILQKCNLRKYDYKNYIGNSNNNYYRENLLTVIQKNSFILIHNLYLINDYPRIWSYIKQNKILVLGVKQQLVLKSLMINNNISEIIKLQKEKSIINLFLKNCIILTEKYIDKISFSQILLSKKTEELNNNWISTKADNSNSIDSDIIVWNLTNSNLKNGISLLFATHGDKNKKANTILLPITNFLEEYSVRLDPYGFYQMSIPIAIRAANVRYLKQILQIIKIIFSNSYYIKENLLLKDILSLKYGKVNNNFKILPDYIQIPSYKQYNNFFINKIDRSKSYETIKIKEAFLKKNNNY